MWSMWTRAQRDEVERHRLVFCCEDCLHFRADADRAVSVGPQPAGAGHGGAAADPQSGGCDLLYPTGPHRRVTVEALPEGAPMAFCKMFEAD